MTDVVVQTCPYATAAYEKARSTTPTRWLDVTIDSAASWGALIEDHELARSTGSLTPLAVSPLTRYVVTGAVDDARLRQYLRLPEALRLAFRRDARLGPMVAACTVAVTGFGGGLFALGASLPETLVLLRSGELHAFIEPAAGIVIRIGERAARVIELASGDPRTAAITDARSYTAFAFRRGGRTNPCFHNSGEGVNQ